MRHDDSYQNETKIIRFGYGLMNLSMCDVNMNKILNLVKKYTIFFMLLDNF
jgi:hypothetical protein